MKIVISEAEKQFENLVDLLIEGKEEEITLLKDGEPVIKLVPFKSRSKRIGAAKEEMNDFDLDLDKFNSISFDSFGS